MVRRVTYVVEWGGGIEHPVSLTLGPLGDTLLEAVRAGRVEAVALTRMMR